MQPTVNLFTSTKWLHATNCQLVYLYQMATCNQLSICLPLPNGYMQPTVNLFTSTQWLHATHCQLVYLYPMATCHLLRFTGLVIKFRKNLKLCLIKTRDELKYGEVPAEKVHTAEHLWSRSVQEALSNKRIMINFMPSWVYFVTRMELQCVAVTSEMRTYSIKVSFQHFYHEIII